MENKQLLSEIRGLLNNYPFIVSLNNRTDNIRFVIEDILTIYDLLYHCKSKSKKEEVQEMLEKEIKEIEEKLDISSLRLFKLELDESTIFGRGRRMRKLISGLLGNLNFIINKIQFYILSMPLKAKQNMHLRTAQGLPAAVAEEYESSEIAEGQKVRLGQSFSLDDEGKVIPVD